MALVVDGVVLALPPRGVGPCSTLRAMGSLPFVLQTVLPRSGAVPPNSAIVLEGHVVGSLSVTARAAGVDVSVVLESTPEPGPRAPGTIR